MKTSRWRFLRPDILTTVSTVYVAPIKTSTDIFLIDDIIKTPYIDDTCLNEIKDQNPHLTHSCFFQARAYESIKGVWPDTEHAQAYL